MKVERIVDDCVNSGVKNNKQWSQASVQLDDGQIVRIFNPVMVGDEVESEVNGKYTNWKVKKSTQAVSNDVEKLINQMAKEIQTLSRRVEALEARTPVQGNNFNGNESRVSDSNEMPESFLKTSFKLNGESDE